MPDAAAEIEILVFPGGIPVSCPSGVRLHELLAGAGLSLSTPCGGNGTCGKCVVWVASGQTFPDKLKILYRKHSPAVYNFATLQEMYPFQQVLACQYPVREPLVVWLSEESQQADAPQILTSHRVLNSPDHDDVPLTPAHLAAGGANASHAKTPDDRAEQYVVAVDIGTTTIAAELMCVQTGQAELAVETETGFRNLDHRHCGVRSCRNPQARFGDDVISRIQYASESPENAERLRSLVVGAINELIAALAREEAISPTRITLAAVAGNTVMQQLFVGLDVQPLGHSPFEPATKHYRPVRAAECGLTISPEGWGLLFPVIGGFVGGDLVAGMIATKLCSQIAPSLLIDIGTNGEIILWHPDGLLLAAATAAGPAFEGARIARGMIAAPGAIERVAVTDDLHLETIGNRPPRGICGSGLIDLVAELIRIGAVTSSGKLLAVDQLPESVPNAIRDRFKMSERQPTFVITPPDESELDGPITLTQLDIRQVQLAAGAIRAGVTLLLRKAGIKPEELANVFLAGGFGNYIRRENAQQIGLLPPEIPTERIQFFGNTSLAGAKAALLSASVYDGMQSLADTAVCVDLSKFPEFSGIFAESMLFPPPRIS